MNEATYFWRRRRAIAAYLLIKKYQNQIHITIGKLFKKRNQQGALEKPFKKTHSY